MVARDQSLPVTAIPVFLHRRFRHGFVYINTGKGITKPTDLIGRKIGVKSYLTTACHWLRGILEHEYGVPHKSIEWFAELDEEVEFTPPADLKLTKLPNDKSVETMLVEGELDAVLHADLIEPIINKDPRVGRLWPELKSEERPTTRRPASFRSCTWRSSRTSSTGIPGCRSICSMPSKVQGDGHAPANNPRIVPLAWYREAWEEQEKIIGPDPWEYGLTDRNRHTLETMAAYSHEQGLTRRKMSPDELFVSVFQGRKRGDKFGV